MNPGEEISQHDDEQEELLPQFDHQEDPSDEDLVEMEIDQDGLDAVFDAEEGDGIVFSFEGDFDEDDLE
ncbi:MAG: hypothetical protein P1V18_04775 [Candidatus Gracilibacteria bacterium]|nr:hypothetical protein [Candidatus Gracilibacteria bacterium]